MGSSKAMTGEAAAGQECEQERAGVLLGETLVFMAACPFRSVQLTGR